MFDFRLHVFHVVARRRSFTRAAEELFITQPAVTKHIRELESHFKLSLFERSGNRKIRLTPAGEVLLRYTERLSSVYKELEFEMNALTSQHKGVLKIGASTTIAQYIIPPILAQFHSRFKDIKVRLMTANTEQIENALLHKDIDLGMIEGYTRNPNLNYQEFIQDEIVLVAGSANPAFKKDAIRPEDLKKYPLLVREPGSGTLEVLAHALKEHNIRLADLQIEMELGSPESIKSYLLNSNCLAFLSVAAIFKELKAGDCRIIDIKGLSIKRPFSFIQLHGQPLSLSALFIRFAEQHKKHS